MKRIRFYKATHKDTPTIVNPLLSMSVDRSQLSNLSIRIYNILEMTYDIIKDLQAMCSAELQQ